MESRPTAMPVAQKGELVRGIDRTFGCKLRPSSVRLSAAATVVFTTGAHQLLNYAPDAAHRTRAPIAGAVAIYFAIAAGYQLYQRRTGHGATQPHLPARRAVACTTLGLLLVAGIATSAPSVGGSIAAAVAAANAGMLLLAAAAHSRLWQRLMRDIERKPWAQLLRRYDGDTDQVIAQLEYLCALTPDQVRTLVQRDPGHQFAAAAQAASKLLEGSLLRTAVQHAAVVLAARYTERDRLSAEQRVQLTRSLELLLQVTMVVCSNSRAAIQAASPARRWADRLPGELRPHSSGAAA